MGRTARTAVLLLAAPTLLALLTGCGGGSGGTSGAPSGGASASASAAADGVRWARCMREHGVQVEDPTAGGPVQITGDGDSGTLQAAQQACAAYAPRADLDPAAQAQVQEQVLAFTRCMREHGVDLPDPQSKGDGSVVIGGPGGGSGTVPDPNSPAFRSAQQACATLLPKPPSGSGR
jgi:hypothetical protein